MREFKRSTRNDYRYRAKQIDFPPPDVDVAKSITELHAIYGAKMTDAQFAEWYAVRYGLRAAAVVAVLAAQRK